MLKHWVHDPSRTWCSSSIVLISQSSQNNSRVITQLFRIYLNKYRLKDLWRMETSTTTFWSYLWSNSLKLILKRISTKTMGKWWWISKTYSIIGSWAKVLPHWAHWERNKQPILSFNTDLNFQDAMRHSKRRRFGEALKLNYSNSPSHSTAFLLHPWPIYQFWAFNSP